jgi:hypothetical protein
MKIDIDIQAAESENFGVNGKTTNSTKTIIPEIEVLQEEINIRIAGQGKVYRAAMPVDLVISIHARLRYSVVAYGRN